MYGKSRALHTLLLLLASAVLAGCNADRNGAAWETEVWPNLICAGEPVILRWRVPEQPCDSIGQYFDGRCMDPVHVTIEYASQGAPIQQSAILARWYEQVIHPEQDTVFSFEARDRNDTLLAYEHRVQVVGPESPRSIAGTFAGACASAVPTWSDLQLAPGIVPSSHLAVAGFCNPNGFPVRLTALASSDVFTSPLTSQACASITPIPITTTIRVLPLNESLASSRHCAAALIPPPDIPMELFLTCTP